MRLLLVDGYGGDGMLDFAMRAKEDGHNVRWYFPPNLRTDEIGKGLVERVDDWRLHMRWADLVVLSDNTKYLREMDAWRKNYGSLIIGSTSEAATWELDRKIGQDIFKKAGIDTLPYREFTNYDQAIAFVKKENRAFVSKPSYDEADKSLSYVAKTPVDLIYMLERWKKAKKLKGAFILQEKTSGCEMAVGGWLGPGGFNEGWCENWEFKSLMAGDMGPNCGEMGTVLRFTRASKLARKVLAPMEDRLVSMGYTGYVDVNCIIDEDGTPWPLEWTMRMGWPTFNIQQALVKGDRVEWLADLSQGRDAKPFLQQVLATGVVMALPEFPYNKTPMEKVMGVPLYGLTKSLRRNVHLCQAKMGEAPMDMGGKIETRPCLVAAGDYVLVASGTGDTVRQARGRAYRTLEKIKAPASPFWRPDIGQRLKEQLPQVQSKGYATGMLF